MLTKKIISILGLSVLYFSFSYGDVEDTVADVAKHAMDKAAEVAMQDKTETTVNDVQQYTDIDLEESGVLGNVGNKIDGDKVKADHVVQKSKIKMKQAVVVGDVGNTIGSR
jgi:hypothetical protein